MQVMDVPALIAHALAAVGGNQAELARRLGRSETTVSRWVTGRNGIDYESCLRLAKITRLPPRSVVEAAGLDADLLPPAEPEAGLTPSLRDLFVRMARINAAVDAADGLPDDFVPVYLAKILDNTEDEVLSTINMVMGIRAGQRERAASVTSAETSRVTVSTQSHNVADEDPAAPLSGGYGGWKIQSKNLAQSVTLPSALVTPSAVDNFPRLLRIPAALSVVSR